MPDQVGSYNYGDVIEMDPTRKNALHYITKPLKETIYDIGVRLFKRNKVQAQAQLSVPPESLEYLKSVKLKRIFFVLDTCVGKSRRCSSTVEGIEATFVKELFINLEPYKEGTEIEEIKEIDDNTFFQKAKEFVRDFGSKRRRGVGGFQLAAYSQKNRPNRSQYKNLYVFKYDKNISKLRDALEQSRHVKKTILFGDLVLAELQKSKNSFISRIYHEESFKQEVESHHSYLNPAACEKGNCTELKTNSENLVEFFKEHPNVVVNTFIKVAKLPKKDFHYKGFIEFEVELNI